MKHISQSKLNPNLTICFNQQGMVAVEFALIAIILFSFLFGAMEMSRALFYWNTATEATRLGARLAVVCDQDASAIKTKMQAMLGVLETDQISVTYSPDGCDSNSCRSVTVSINGFNFTTLVPVLPLNIPMPSFSTTLPRESMDSANPDCA